MTLIFNILIICLAASLVAGMNLPLRDKRIVDGVDARTGGFPWQVSILIHGRLVCGGTLVTMSHVMSAAHCFKAGATVFPVDIFRVVLGTYNRSAVETDKKVRRVSRVVVHEDYQDGGDLHVNDIAIVTLESPVELSDRIYPACLAASELAVGTDCYVTGWGKTYAWSNTATVLQELKTKIVGLDDCRKKNERENSKVTDLNICSGDESSFASGCRGDSGGPLSCVDPLTQEWRVFGVVSWGDVQCNGLDHYTVYTKVLRYIGWIELATDGWFNRYTCFRDDP